MQTCGSLGREENGLEAAMVESGGEVTYPTSKPIILMNIDEKKAITSEALQGM